MSGLLSKELPIRWCESPADNHELWIVFIPVCAFERLICLTTLCRCHMSEKPLSKKCINSPCDTKIHKAWWVRFTQQITFWQRARVGPTVRMLLSRPPADTMGLSSYWPLHQGLSQSCYTCGRESSWQPNLCLLVSSSCLWPGNCPQYAVFKDASELSWRK